MRFPSILACVLFVLAACDKNSVSSNEGGGGSTDVAGGATGGNGGGHFAGSGGAEQSPQEEGPELLFDTGAARPVALHLSNSSLYWGQGNPGQGNEIMTAPVDGSETPKKIGDYSAIDISGDNISSFEGHVVWQHYPNLVVHNLENGTQEEFDLDLGDTGPTLAVRDRWVVSASWSCREFAIWDAESKEVTKITVSDAFYGGGTQLVELGEYVYCGNGPTIYRFAPGTTTVETFLETTDGLFIGNLRKYKERLVVSRTRPNAAADERLATLSFLGADGSDLEEFARWEGKGYGAEPDSTNSVIYLLGGLGNTPIQFYRPESGQWGKLEGDHTVRGRVVSDSDYLYWPDTSSISDEDGGLSASGGLWPRTG